MALQVSENHKGDDQSVQANTFGKTYEDEGLTEDGGIFTDGAESRAGRAGNGDTAADAGDTDSQSSSDKTQAVHSAGLSSGFLRLGNGGGGLHVARRERTRDRQSEGESAHSQEAQQLERESAAFLGAAADGTKPHMNAVMTKTTVQSAGINVFASVFFTRKR